MNEYFEKLNINDKTLLNLISTNLFNNDKKINCKNVDYAAVFKEAYFQTVPLVTFNNFDFSKTDNKSSLLIKSALANVFARNSKVNFEHTRIHSIMKNAGIRYTIIKGLATALYYPDPVMRSMGDIDFLISPKDLDKTHAVLIENGFKQIKDFHDNHYVYTYDNCRYELHFEVSGIPKNDIGNELKHILKPIFDDSAEIETEFGCIVVPSCFHQGMISVLHICSHLIGDGIGLRHICDWAVFISKFKYEDFCDLFENVFKRVGLWEFVSVLNDICINYLGCNFNQPKNMVNPEISYELLSDVFSGGNFGQKNNDRSHEQLIINENGNSLTNGTIIKELFKSANRIVYSHWKIARKLKLFLPFGWLFFGLRYILRSFRGKRPKIRIKNIIIESKERHNLYSKLKLFKNTGGN